MSIVCRRACRLSGGGGNISASSGERGEVLNGVLVVWRFVVAAIVALAFDEISFFH